MANLLNGYIKHRLGEALKPLPIIFMKGDRMPISYQKLFILMKTLGLKKVDLRRNGFSPTVINRLVKNEDVNTKTIIKLCELLKCQPGDIMEYIEAK